MATVHLGNFGSKGTRDLGCIVFEFAWALLLFYVKSSEISPMTQVSERAALNWGFPVQGSCN